jgi:hypothetical protein
MNWELVVNPRGDWSAYSARRIILRFQCRGSIKNDGNHLGISAQDFFVVRYEWCGSERISLQGREEPGTKGGGPAVWINKHTRCMKVMEHMK